MDKPNFVSFLVFAGATASFFFFKFHLSKLSRNEKPFRNLSENSEYPMILRVTGANQNAPKLLSTDHDLVNTNMFILTNNNFARASRYFHDRLRPVEEFGSPLLR